MTEIRPVDIFKDYLSQMAEIQLYYRTAKKSSRDELGALEKYKEHVKNNPEFEKYSKSLDNISFLSALNGEHFFYGFKETTIDEKIQRVLIHKNKQYQWFLAEAYERYEDFLEKIYANIGYTNNNSWPLQDFGNITLSDLKSKDYDWFSERVKDKKGKPTSIRNWLRQKYPELSRLEKENKINTNLHLSILAIEYFRHIIVHNAGRVQDAKKSIEKILSDAGVFKNGKYSEDDYNFLAFYFAGGALENNILLLEYRIEELTPIESHIDRLDSLFSCLLSDAEIIIHVLEKKPST
jgi:hypothetical protein